MITTSLTTNGLLSQLAEEVIEEYDTGESGADVADIVANLLAFQRKSTPITVGTIGVTGTRAIQVTTARTILSVLLELQESVGGYINVDNDRVLDWPTDTGEDKGQQIRYRKNLVGIERTRNWEDFCTKLHLTGGEGKLSDITVGPVAVDTDTDATYGYITLKEAYSAYLGFTAEGEALPANVTIWKENAAPAEITPSNGSGAGWFDIERIYDGVWDTFYAASAAGSGEGTYSSWAYVDIASASYVGLHLKTSDGMGRLGGMQIEVYDGADWTNIYDGSESKNGYIYFPVQTVERIRIRAKYGWASDQLEVFEILGLEADISDDTANWVQGAFENIARCDIGDWDAGATYLISYTHANYLVAWDKITDGDDIVAHIVPVPSRIYSISLVEYGRILLTELKEDSYTYAIDAVNLAEVDKKFSFDELQLGSIITVIDEDLGIDISARVVRISFDALQPERMQIEISSRIRDIADIIAGMNKLIREV